MVGASPGQRTPAIRAVGSACDLAVRLYDFAMCPAVSGELPPHMSLHNLPCNLWGIHRDQRLRARHLGNYTLAISRSGEHSQSLYVDHTLL